MQDGVQLRVVERILLHGQRVVLKAHGLDRIVGDGFVDELGIGMLCIGHAHGEAGQILLCRFDVAEVGEVIALRFADHGDALCDAVFRGVHPIMLRGQKQCVDLSLCDQIAVLFNVFHDESSMFQLQ